MSKKAYLMDRPQDYKKFGISPDNVEVWEDGRRSISAANQWEWWYFDAIMDDGTAIIIQFFAKPTIDARKKQDVPTINFQISLPDGKHETRELQFTTDESTFSNEKCELHFGKNYFTGDLKHYDIHVETADEMAADLSVESLSTPFRPGTSYFDFSGDGSKYYTWLCCMPKGEVNGTITVAGKEIFVHGYGYHDHQWGNFTYALGWNHWTWARQRFDDYTLILFDMTSSRTYGAVRYPICYLEDKDGNIVFSNTDTNHCQINVLEEYTDDVTGKVYPQKTEYIFQMKDKKLVYELESKKIIDAPDIAKRTGFLLNFLLGLKGLKPSYARYIANGTMNFTSDNHKISRSESLIYEFMYPGKTYKL